MKGEMIMLDDMATLNATTTTPLTDEELVSVGGGGPIFGGPSALPITPGKLGYLGAAAGAGFAVGNYITANSLLDERLGDWLIQVLPPWPSNWSF